MLYKLYSKKAAEKYHTYYSSTLTRMPNRKLWHPGELGVGSRGRWWLNHKHFIREITDVSILLEDDGEFLLCPLGQSRYLSKIMTLTIYFNPSQVFLLFILSHFDLLPTSLLKLLLRYKKSTVKIKCFHFHLLITCTYIRARVIFWTLHIILDDVPILSIYLLYSLLTSEH